MDRNGTQGGSWVPGDERPNFISASGAPWTQGRQSLEHLRTEATLRGQPRQWREIRGAGNGTLGDRGRPLVGKCSNTAWLQGCVFAAF